jgi:hypothetical protein
MNYRYECGVGAVAFSENALILISSPLHSYLNYLSNIRSYNSVDSRHYGYGCSVARAAKPVLEASKPEA